MILIVVIAILSMVTVPDWIQAEQDAALSSADQELLAAQLALERSAAEDTGATLSVNGSLLTITGNAPIGNATDWVGHLPSGATVLIQGQPLGCLSLNGEDVPAVSPTCSNAVSLRRPWSMTC